MDNDFLKATLEFDGWSTARVIERCAGLTDEELSRETGIGRSKIGVELAHLAGSYGMFGTILADEAFEHKPGSDNSPKALLESFNNAHGRFMEVALAAAADGRLGEMVTIPWNGKQVTKLHWILAAVDHSTFHRSELELMLASLGLEAFPGVSVLTWAQNK